MGVLPSAMLALLAVAVVHGYPSDAGVATPTSTSSLLLRRLEMIQARDEEEAVDETTTPASPSLPKPEMYSLKVTSLIEHRFANTLIASRLANPANQSQQIFFSVTLPESAFISRFLMEIEGKVYEAYVKEKEAAKQEYDQAVASGLGAAHVALSARDSNRFTVSVNIEPQSKVKFNLTYEELLTRRLGAYNHVINLDPGQLVRDLTVDVYISESTNITTLRVPELRSGNEVDANELTKANPLARIVRKSPTHAHVSFAPTIEQQKELGQAKKQEALEEQEGHADKEGLGGQFVVQYDVDRAQQGGEILVNDGFFVHFFAPKDLAPLKKHALFVLDVSGSMGGRKIEQLKQAMTAILDDLNEGDYFNIIEFSYSVKVWNLDSTAASAVFSPYNAYNYDAPAPNPGPTPAFPATPDYVAKAKDIVNKMRAGGGTNIFDTLKTVIKVAHTGLENITTLGDERREPIIVFLTDGEPTVGETRLGKIFSVVQELNTQPEAAIFSLAFGDDADLGFLKKLSLKNAGFARKIYEASDAALQLRDFYRQIASPLLANVTFNYVPDKIVKDSTTKINFHTLFSGSELVVAGKLSRLPDSVDSINGEIVGISATGASSIPIFHLSPIDFIPDAPREEREPSSLERLWAYLTIKQLLEEEETNAVEQSGNLGDKMEAETSTNETKTPKQQALELALKYSFVTPLTSLVVVKPNETKSTGVETVNPVDGDSNNKFSGNFGMVDRISLSGISLPLLSQSAVQHFSQPMPQPISFGGAPSSSGFSGPSAAFARPPSPKRPAFLSTTMGPRPSVDISLEESLQEEEVAEVEVAAVAGDEDAGTTAVEPEYTTVVPITQEPELLPIGDLDWLPLVLNGTDLTLPFGENNADVHYQIFSKDASESNVTDVACKTPEGVEKTCLHLYECSLSLFKKEIAAYQPFFCSLGNYAGVCCPVVPTKTQFKSLPWDTVVFPSATITDFHAETSDPHPNLTSKKEQPNDPGFYLTHQGSQSGKIAPATIEPLEAMSVTNAAAYPILGASIDLVNVAEVTPKETSTVNSVPHPVKDAFVDAVFNPLPQGSQTVKDTVLPEANVETSTSVVQPTQEQPNDPGLHPIHQNVKVTEVSETNHEESSALNPGFHPVYDMKTSIVEADPKPV